MSPPLTTPLHALRIAIERENDAVHLVAQDDRGHSVSLDGAPSIGGQDLGFRPMEMVLVALAGCTSMDVLSILAKRRQTVTAYRIEAEGQRADAVPAVFTHIHLTVHIAGPTDAQAVDDALRLSLDKYCSVALMLKPTVEITHSFVLTTN